MLLTFDESILSTKNDHREVLCFREGDSQFLDRERSACSVLPHVICDSCRNAWACCVPVVAVQPHVLHAILPHVCRIGSPATC